jgi:hypothetical protein
MKRDAYLRLEDSTVGLKVDKLAFLFLLEDRKAG